MLIGYARVSKVDGAQARICSATPCCSLNLFLTTGRTKHREAESGDCDGDAHDAVDHES